MLLISSGFAEIGPSGKALEEELIQKAAQTVFWLSAPTPWESATAIFTCIVPEAMCCRNRSNCRSRTVRNMGTQLLAFAEQQGIGIRAFCGSATKPW